MIDKTPSLIIRTEQVNFQFDGKNYMGHDGETIAVALLRNNVRHIRNAPNSNTSRGMFCVMGVCQECVVEINGQIKEACRTPVSQGLIVKRVGVNNV